MAVTLCLLTFRHKNIRQNNPFRFAVCLASFSLKIWTQKQLRTWHSMTSCEHHLNTVEINLKGPNCYYTIHSRFPFCCRQFLSDLPASDERSCRNGEWIREGKRARLFRQKKLYHFELSRWLPQQSKVLQVAFALHSIPFSKECWYVISNLHINLRLSVVYLTNSH